MDKQQEGFVIVGPTEDGETLYWSNRLGWVSRKLASVLDASFLNSPKLEEEVRRESAPLKQRVLVLVHPGSACGSADFNIGFKLAQEGRDAICQDLESWTGDILVVDGFLSDELDRYPRLFHAIHGAFGRAACAQRVFACDSVGRHFSEKLPGIIETSAWSDPTRFGFVLTGAWYDPENRWGCVNGVVDLLNCRGFDTQVLDSAMQQPEEETETA